MGAAIGLRGDFGSGQLRALAKMVKDAGQARRLPALAVIYDGGRRTEAARIGGVGLQIIRDWLLRFNARGPDGLIGGNPWHFRPRAELQNQTIGWPWRKLRSQGGGTGV